MIRFIDTRSAESEHRHCKWQRQPQHHSSRNKYSDLHLSALLPLSTILLRRDQPDSFSVHSRGNCVGNLLDCYLSPILLRDRAHLVPSGREGYDPFWQRRSFLARRLQPAVAGAKPDSLYSEPLDPWDIRIDPLVWLLVPDLAPVQETN